jgi:hypothetical protein
MVSTPRWEGRDMPSIVPALSDLLNQSPTSADHLDDGQITTRCPKSDCFALQRLAESAITRGMFECRYSCGVCGTTMVVVRPSTAADPGLPVRQTSGAWTYWTTAVGVHLRIVSTSRVRIEPTQPETT